MNSSPLASILGCLLVASLGSPLLAQSDQQGKHQFSFSNVSDSTGVQALLDGIRGHAACWGDADGNGFPDLYVGTFHTAGLPNQLLRNVDGAFELDPQPVLQISSRPTGALLVDLDNDGDLDLYVSSMPASSDSKLAARTGRTLRGCSLFENLGEGRFRDVSRGNGACPVAFGGRSAAASDFNGDGRLDLLVGEDPLAGYNGSETSSSRIFKNLGDLRFEDVSAEVGLPAGIPGLGVTAADVNGDGWPDIFLAGTGDSNRLFLNDSHGRFVEHPDNAEVFAWRGAGGDNMVCGVTIADTNGDALPDIILAQHFERPWEEPVANRLYLNRGTKAGLPRFEDVTERAGLLPLPMKTPHVEVQDFDNDGRPDLFASMAKFDGKDVHPLIFHHDGTRDGIPQYSQTALAVNDFPNESDRSIRRSGTFFSKMLQEGKVIYTAPAPSCDFDRDGRLDILMASWWPESPSLLLQNQTMGGNWLDIQVQGDGEVNAQGVGSRVLVYKSGKLGDSNALLGCREITVGSGYASGHEAAVHFGLGSLNEVDVEVLLPHNRGAIRRQGVHANQRLIVSR